jgi:hypothetical protein
MPAEAPAAECTACSASTHENSDGQQPRAPCILPLLSSQEQQFPSPQSPSASKHQGPLPSLISLPPCSPVTAIRQLPSPAAAPRKRRQCPPACSPAAPARPAGCPPPQPGCCACPQPPPAWRCTEVGGAMGGCTRRTAQGMHHSNSIQIRLGGADSWELQQTGRSSQIKPTGRELHKRLSHPLEACQQRLGVQALSLPADLIQKPGGGLHRQQAEA